MNKEDVIDLKGYKSIGDIKVSPCLKCEYKSKCSKKRARECKK
jgi:hypothetical protein